MILAILQARMSSSRLPGKVLMPILGKPMLFFQIERVLRSNLLDKLVIATSNDSSDDPIESFCEGNGVECFRGSLNNVLDRYYRCAEKFKPDTVVRLTGDCPLADPEVIDSTVRYFIDNNCDYVTNGGKEPTFPDGLDVEVFTFESLRESWENAELPSEKEHVTQYIKRHPGRHKLGVYKNQQDFSGLRWTVDEPRDFELVSKIYKELYPNNFYFTTDDIITLFKRKPDLAAINAGIERNEGLKKSLSQDEEFLNYAK